MKNHSQKEWFFYWIEMSYFVYVLRSIDHHRNYVGFTTDVQIRVQQHNSGQTKSTKPYKPWRLLFYETFSTKKEALDREKFLKSGQGRDLVRRFMEEESS